MAEEQKKGQGIPVSLNSFYKGMNKDMAKYAMPDDQYYDANNVRIVANSGKEGAAMVNIEGNDHLIDIPDSPAVFELKLDPNTEIAGQPWAFTLSFSAGTWGVFSISMNGVGGNPIRSLASTLIDFTAGGWAQNGIALTDTPSYLSDGKPGFYHIFDESSNRLIIWGKPFEADFEEFPDSPLNYRGCDVQQVSTPVFSVLTLGGVSTNFINTTNLAVAQSSLSIIGYANLREYIYLFTSNTAGVGGPGQIWKLYVNPSIQNALGITAHIECVYARNTCMRFTQTHPIEAIGRYEKKNIQSVYWTDNYNPPRKLNVASGVSMAVPCAFLDLAPKTGFSVPILNRITIGGSLPGGLYQLCYRYKSSEGISTEWSPLSNLVPIYEASDDNPYCEIIGDPLNVLVTPTIGKETTKRIDWTITGLDTSFELIEVAAVYKKNDIPANDEIFIFGEYINGSFDLTVTLTGNEVHIPVTAVDFITGLGATFEKVKTIDTKDNKLFFGNIENSTFIVDFDARAYRFDSGQVATIDSLSEGSLNVATTGAAGTIFPNLVPETHDCINAFNEENPNTNPNWFTNDQFQFQDDGVTLGGTGTNVSYKFVTEQDVGDSQRDNANTDTAYQTFYTDMSCNTYNTSPSQACFISPAAFGGAGLLPPAFLSGNVNLGIAAQNYEMNTTFNSMKSPYKWSLYGSYARGEVYRFGIVFYNNKGQASFVNWIGDIRMPFSYSAGLGTPLGTFGVSTWVPDFTSPSFGSFTDNANVPHSYRPHGQIRLNQIGIEFSVDFSSLDSNVLANITGYSIVRCDRTDKDKSRFGTALAHTVDRLDMRGSKWDGLSPSWEYSWGGDNKQSVLIPSTGNLALPCGGLGLAYCDGSAGAGDTCDMKAWNSSTWNPISANINPYTVCKTRKTELLLYGPLGWHNSDAAEEGNLNEGLESTFPIKKGDYIKQDQVYYPTFNATMGLNTFPNGTTGAGLPVGYFQPKTNHWYKYYTGINLTGGILGSVQSTQIDYQNGIISNLNGQDPANNRYSLEWGTWVPDGGYIDNNPVPSLQWPFMNVTNPAWAGIMDVMNFPVSLSYTWMWNRPMSIGSEVLFLRFEKDGKEWQGADHIMGASISVDPSTMAGTAPQFQAVPTRSTFSYERYTTPYGGPTYAARTYNEYMSTGHFVPINSGVNLAAPVINTVFGGDVQCQVFDYTQFEKNWGQTGFDNYDSIIASGGSNPPEDAEWGQMRACMVPLECHYKNILWRHGYHFASKKTNSGSYPNTGINLHDEYRLNEAYNAQNNVRTYFPLPLTFSKGDEFDTRIYYSQTKINGEPSDSWSVFLIDDYKDVEGVYGPINKLITLHDTMYYYQDTGFGALSVNPTAVVQGADGVALQLGTISSGSGAFIQSYQYISTQYGSSQQWAVTKSDNAIYFFDIKARKLFNYSSKGTAPLSDITGLHSFFSEELRGDVLTNDNPILKKGISSAYDSANSEALFTFHDAGYTRKYDQTILFGAVVGGAPNRIGYFYVRNVPGFNCNPCFNQDCEEYADGTSASFSYIIVNNLLINGVGPFMGMMVGRVGCPSLPTPSPNPLNLQAGDLLIWIPELWNDWSGFQPDNVTFDDLANITSYEVMNMECAIGTKSTTIAYNELIQGFTSFYDFHPSIYVTTPQFLITPSTQNICEQDIDVPGYKENKLYLHNYGIYGKFYDVLYPSTVTFISNLESAATKVFDNVSFHMESLWEVGRADANIRNTTSFGSVGPPNRLTGLNSGNPNIKPIDIKDNTFDQIRFYTDYQITDYIDLVPGTNIKKKEREWQMAVPRNVMDENILDGDIFNVFNYDSTRQHKDRLRDKYMFIDLIYNNYNTEVGQPRNIKFVLHYFKTFFRPSYR